MKILENLLLKAAGYTVLILSLFYLFGSASNLTNAYIDSPTFLTILAFGGLISVAGLLLKTPKLHIVLRVLIHYLALLVAFFVVFITSGNLAHGNAGNIFSAVVIFSILYTVMFAIVYVARLLVKKSDKSITTHTAKSDKAKKSEYKPLYKSED